MQTKEIVMKQSKYVAAAMLAIMLLAGQAVAWDVIDVYDTDLNIVGGVLDEPGSTKLLELYGEHELVTYPSHDGYGVVDQGGGCPDGTCWFDKVFLFSPNVVSVGHGFEFGIANDTGYEWSDYHIEFWNTEFTERLVDFPLVEWDTDDFDSTSFDGSILSLYSPGSVPDGEMLVFILITNPGALGEVSGFGMRQVATTVVPEPISSTLFLIGGAALGFRRMRKKRVPATFRQGEK